MEFNLKANEIQYKVEFDKIDCNSVIEDENKIRLKIQDIKITIIVWDKIKNSEDLDIDTKDWLFNAFNAPYEVTESFIGEPTSFNLTPDLKIDGHEDGFRFLLHFKDNKTIVRYGYDLGEKNMCSIFAYYKENDKNAIDTIDKIINSIKIEKLDEPPQKTD